MTLRKKQTQKDTDPVVDIPRARFDDIYEDHSKHEHVGQDDSRSHGFLWNIVTNNKRSFALVLIVIVVPLSSAFYFHWFNIGLSKQEIQQRQIASVVSSIGKLMIVPKGTPVLATVKDVSKLKKQQTFFRNAQNGDNLVIFPQSGRAVIYSPSRNLIVNVGPVKYPKTPNTVSNSSRSSGSVTGLQKTNSAVTVANSGKITVDVRNGSEKTGLATAVAKNIEKKSLYSVIKIDDASKHDYKKSFVVDITKKSSESSSINSLAKSLRATVISELPYGEKPSNADVVIILGSS